MITLVGVGHVFAISDRVSELIRRRTPEVVCLELDIVRFRALMDRQRSTRVPLQYSLLAMFQRRMAEKFGTEVGDEMLAAARAAQETGAKLALIDMDASTLMTRLWHRMPLKEKLGLLAATLVGLVSSKETVEREIEAYQENDEAYIEGLGRQFPVIKEVLIDDRNRIMAARLATIAKEHRDIVAIVGDGHVPGIAEELAQHEVEIVRLKELMSRPPEDAAEYTTSFTYRTDADTARNPGDDADHEKNID